MFTGYSDKTVDFFWDIRFNNSREWFHPRKDQFNEYIMTPTKELSGELYDWLTENHPQLHLNLHISKIYRDARRLFGRGPLKDHIWFSFQNELEGRENAPCLWFEVGCEGYSYGFGYWSQPAAAARFRKYADQHLKELEKLTDLSAQAKAQYDAQAKAWAKRNKREKTIYTIGSGINYGEVYSTAMCWFMEMQWINSGCIHSGEYFHGPFEVTDYDVPFMLVKSIGHTRHLDERVENFAKKFTEDLLVLDQKDLDLSTVADEAKPYVAAILTGVVIRHFVEAIAFERGHSLDVRRYMWQMQY